MKTIPAAEGVLADRTLVGTDVAEAYTAEIDAWLRAVIAEVGEVPGFALAAVGGYGRGDLSPGSDLDLLLIHQFEGSAAEVAERIWYPIWDSGMKLGHAVRTIDEALDLAGEDLDTATSLLEMRCLGGSEKLVDELAKKALGQWRENRDRMLDTMSARIRERHLEAGELAFLLEPDLKLSQGGLRDLHSLRWIDLADSTLLEESERSALAGPHETLLSARIELHRSTGRANNQLLLQEQDEVAAALGYGDADDLVAAVAGAARTVSWIQDSVLHRVHQRGRRRRWLKKNRDLGHGLQLVDDTLTLSADAAADDPIMPLRVAVHAARHDAFIEREVLERIELEGTQLPDPWPDEARQLFIDLLLCGHDMIRVVEALDHFDLVNRLIPEWAPNRNRPQRNAYHRFTVDRHLLEAAAEAARLVDRVERPDLLVLGGLFHDIGKGYPGDHSQVGIGLVNAIATRMGYPAEDVGALEALVEHHLLLPDIASRRDLDDEGTVMLVADAVGSVIDCLTKGIEEGRRVIRGIRPAVLDDLGLGAAIEDLVSELQETGIAVGCELDPTIEAIPPPLQTTVYRVVQESLNNARKHSGSRRVSLTVCRVAKQLVVTVEDFGCGFDRAKTRGGGFGLVSMRERSRLLGGDCIIESTLGQGTKVIIKLPLVENMEGDRLAMGETSPIAGSYDVRE